MHRFARQELIPGWNQARLARACVAVNGRDWLGTFTVWALASLGFGTIVWIGRPSARSQAFGDWLLSDPSPMAGVTICDYPFDVEYGAELGWALSGGVDLLLECTEDLSATAGTWDFSRRRNIPWLVGTTGHGGYFGATYESIPEAGPQDPVAAMIVAGILADAARELFCPAGDGLLPPDGFLSLPASDAAAGGYVVLVGAGGIGVYAATLLAALGYGIYLFDFDRVEVSNLNRQGLFTVRDARNGDFKATAARRALAHLFPATEVLSAVLRVDDSFGQTLDTLADPPVAVLSAVDNARTRLLLQAFGRQYGLPVIQGSTDTFAADCYAQTRDSPTLDEQLSGALSEAASRESAAPRRAGCAADPSYVCPGMLAGAMMVQQLRRCNSTPCPPPFHWRSGSLPIQRSRVDHEFDFSAVFV